MPDDPNQKEKRDTGTAREKDQREIVVKGGSALVASVLASVSTVVAIASGIFTLINGSRISALDARTKTEDASYRFAAEFLNRVGGPVSGSSAQKDDPHKENANFRAMLPALDIIGQASSDASGKSSSDARAVLPIYMALILGEPGAAAAMDPDLKKLKWWLAKASVDDKDTTRVTAAQALSAICRQALINGQLDVFYNGVEAIDQLVDLIPDDDSLEVKNSRTKALTAKSYLARFLERHRDLLAVAKPSNDSTVSIAPETMRAEVTKTLLPTKDALLVAEKQLIAKVNAPPEGSPSSRTAAVLADTKVTLAVTETVFATAKADVLEQPLASGSPGPLSVAASPQAKLDELIGLLASNNPAERQKATRDLAYVGQDAVKRLLNEVEKRETNNSPEDGVVRFAVADALRRMRQPISLDPQDAKLITSLLGVEDKNTRVAAADFLMDLWDGPSIQIVFSELQKHFDSNANPGPGYHINYYLALVVATWARNLNDSIPSAEPGKRMNEVALAKALDWRTKLAGSSHTESWTQTLLLLDDLIARAQKARLNIAANGDKIVTKSEIVTKPQ